MGDETQDGSDEPVEGPDPGGGPDRGRRGASPLPPPRRRFGQWPAALVLACVLVSLAVSAGYDLRVGTVLLAISLLLAATLRGVLPAHGAGLLVVRSRLVDVLTLGVLGVGLLLLGVTLPSPR